MKRTLPFLLVGLLRLPGVAQNLVPNGSFEEYDTCASPLVGYGMYATGWLNLHTQSADYFNACNTGGVVDVPYSQFGYQYPADGDAYVGMATAFPGLDWYREMVGIELTEPLQPGVPVCLSFKMAVGGFGSWSGNSSFRTSKGVGLKFLTQLPTDWQSYLYPNSAALFLDEVPTDTSQWYAVSGTYTPDSAYTHLVVGNFFSDSISEVTILDSTGFGTFEASYAFIDDVRASFTLSYCTQEVGVEEAGMEALMAYPVPCSDMLRVRIREGAVRPLHYSLRDMAGRELVHGLPEPDAGEFIINTQHLPSGVYVLQVTTTQGSLPALSVIHVSP
ncbi:MAG: T9SS type A sorting domain-containing protein [Flavobacteriales bacterium]|nr:T9SS type A sorting domain-containing protein [Flavobacteriales bacterium]